VPAQRTQPLSEPLCGHEVARGQPGERQRPQQRRRWFDADLLSEVGMVVVVGDGRGAEPVLGAERCQQGRAKLQLPGRALDIVGHRGDEPERLPEQADGIAAGVQLLGRLGCAGVPLDGRLDSSSGLVVPGELPADLPGLPGVDLLKRTSDQQMRAHPLGPAHVPVGDLADLVVAEVVRLGALLADDPPPPQLVQRR